MPLHTYVYTHTDGTHHLYEETAEIEDGKAVFEYVGQIEGDPK